ncbi:SDR family NAD(P)-dependent oxidoreductase [Cohnella panacarvi]|uniref:SDR family NAD(P)-dependent oxidoreductase n=1 Tax=Cohnella panacarvi TaxID=400776 RepID=UPI00047AFDDF|nr:SDR family NAD(P)-dependent oxidoreductase [Cohnella panacarvi]
MLTVCVTGTDRGLGLALVRGWLEQGASVIAGRYAAEEIEEHVALRTIYGNKLLLVHMDVASDTSVKAAARSIEAFADRIDVLINNAAILGDITRTIEDELDYEEMLRVYDVNALGPLRVNGALLPLVKRSAHKLIMNISSEAGSVGDCWRNNWFAYAMSKSALNMQTALLHNHVKEAGAAVLSVHPGWIRTFMQGKLDAGATYTPEEAAGHIIALARIPERFRTDKPAYVDLLGKPLPW